MRVVLFSDCGNVICHNGGKLDTKTCGCTCQNAFSGESCLKSKYNILLYLNSQGYIQLIYKTKLGNSLLFKQGHAVGSEN